MTDDGHKDKLCMYFWIVQGPDQKKMRKGKVAGQVAHAAARLARMMTDKEWSEYLNYEVKIVYKTPHPGDLLILSKALSIKRSTIVYDDTWKMFTVYAAVSRDDLSLLDSPVGGWKLA